MLIPNIFKADIADNPKGNIKAEDLASLVAFAYPKQAGILNITGNDCLGTVTNISGTTATITIDKGYIVVFGRLITIEQGTTINASLPNAGTETGVIGIKIDLAESGSNEVKWFQKTSAVITENLLTKPNTGVYEFVLYNYTATSNSLSLSLTTQKIENVQNADFITRNISDNSTKVATTEFVHSLFSQPKTTGKNEQSGYVKLDNGLIIKWGYKSTPSGKIVETVNFDATVPFTQVFTVIATPYNDSQLGTANCLVMYYSTTQFIYQVNSDRTNCMYLAIGV